MGNDYKGRTRRSCFGSAVFLPISRSESRRARLIRTLQAQHSQRIEPHRVCACTRGTDDGRRAQRTGSPLPARVRVCSVFSFYFATVGAGGFQMSKYRMPPTNLFSSCAPAARSNRLTTCDSRSLQASESCAVVNPFGFCSKAASSCCVASFSCSFVSLTAFHLLRLSARVWGFLSCGAGAGQG